VIIFILTISTNCCSAN